MSAIGGTMQQQPARDLMDPFKTEPVEDHLSSHHNQYEPTSNNSNENPTAPSAYYPPSQQDPTGETGMGGFDLNAAGDDDDEDVDGQMDMYQDGVDGHGDGTDTIELDEVDRRSVFVGNVDYGATPPELQEHFKNCGAINRITIMVDKYSGHPKGYAYIEFQDESAIPNAVTLNDSMFRERQLKVSAKRKNVPGYASGRGGRGGFMRGGGYMGRGGSGMFRGGVRGRGRGMRGATGYLPRYRGRGARGVSPY